MSFNSFQVQQFPDMAEKLTVGTVGVGADTEADTERCTRLGGVNAVLLVGWPLLFFEMN